VAVDSLPSERDRANAALGVVFVDDDAQVRSLLRTVLGRDPRLDVLAEGDDGLQALRLAQQLTPPLMLLDISLPRLDGVAAARRIRTLSPQTCVVMYTAHEDGGLDEQALQAGARAVLNKSSPVEDLADTLLHLCASMTAETTVGDQVADELHRSEERFRLLVEAVEDYAIFMLDPAGVIVSWNSGAQRIKGYTASEIVGRHFRVFYPEDKQRSAHPEYELVQALAQGHFEEEGWRVRKDGTLMWANVLITPVYDNAGSHIGFAKVTRDMTERRKVQEKREDFLAVTAHELRTPVNVISGSAATLTRYWADLADQDRELLLETISTSAGRLNRLLSDLLIAAKLESGTVDLNVAEVSLGDVLSEAVATAKATHGDEAPRLHVEKDLVVAADRDRLAQAVDNLIQNAYRHGRPPVDITLRDQSGSAEILVHDAGEGIAPEVQDTVFDRYATSGGSRTTGLGLYIVRELARAHQGDAWWQPSSGAEAGFVISLPLSAARAADDG